MLCWKQDVAIGLNQGCTVRVPRAAGSYESDKGACELARGEVEPASGEVDGKKGLFLWVFVCAHKCTRESILNAELLSLINREQS